MQAQFQYLTDLAKQYQAFADDTDLLFKALNELSSKDIKEVLDTYGNPERNFYPVIFLRNEIARRLLKGEILTVETVEGIKSNIRNRNIDAFRHMSEDFLNQITNYPEKVGDMFNSWSRYWNILHVFFFKGEIKKTTHSYLEAIAIDLISKLDLQEYTFHTVDFQGPNNFGSTIAWLALYPSNKDSHRDSVQFFVGFRAVPDAGLIKGHNLDLKIDK